MKKLIVLAGIGLLLGYSVYKTGAFQKAKEELEKAREKTAGIDLAFLFNYMNEMRRNLMNAFQGLKIEFKPSGYADISGYVSDALSDIKDRLSGKLLPISTPTPKPTPSPTETTTVSYVQPTAKDVPQRFAQALSDVVQACLVPTKEAIIQTYQSLSPLQRALVTAISGYTYTPFGTFIRV